MRAREITLPAVAARAAVALGSAIGQVFVAIGWLAGFLWLRVMVGIFWQGSMFCCVCAAWGFREAAGRPQPDEKPPPEPPS